MFRQRPCCLTSFALILSRRAEDGIPTLRALLERQSPRETKIHRAAAFTLVALGEHAELVEKIRTATDAITRATGPEISELHDALKRDVHTLGELAKQGTSRGRVHICILYGSVCRLFI